LSDQRLTVLEHVDELRRRLIYVVIAVVLATAVGFLYSGDVLRLMMATLASDYNFNLTYKSPMEPFMLRFKLAFVGGVVSASPVILYQILAFLSPALNRREKRVMMMVVFLMILLFLGGVALAYFFVFPMAWQWLVAQGVHLELVQILSATDVIGFALMFFLAFGVIFETPMVLAALVKLKIVSRHSLRKNWRQAYVVMLLVSAVVTPWDVPSMLALGISMIILYEITLLAIRRW
jgi:sec-independent protein translocase protein TatC